MLPTDMLIRRCLDLRNKRIVADDALVDEIEQEIDEYRDWFVKLRRGGSVEQVQDPPEELKRLLWVMGWLIYEGSLQAMRAVVPAFEAATGDRRARSDAAGRLVRRFAEAAKALPCPEFAPRALGAIRADAIVASKRDTRQGYNEAFHLHQEARRRHDSYAVIHGDDPTRELYQIGLKEMLLQLALAETGTACRMAERVIGRWSEELDAANPLWTRDDEALWVQLMYEELTSAVSIGGRALNVAAEIKQRYKFTDEVNENRHAQPTAFRYPGAMTARAALLMLALSGEMEAMRRLPPFECETWHDAREHLVNRFVQAYQAIEQPVEDSHGRPVPLSDEHQRSLLQIRLNFALLAPGYDLPSRLDFVPYLALNPLDDKAVEGLSRCLDERFDDGLQRGDANAIGSAVLPAFIRSVEACRAAFGVHGGYREWRVKWFELDRYSDEPGRRRRVWQALDLPLDD
jgi:hypothetical protein